MPRARNPRGRGASSATVSRGNASTPRKRQLSPQVKAASTVSSGTRQSKRLRGPAAGTLVSIRSKKSSAKQGLEKVSPKPTLQRRSKYFYGKDEKDSDTANADASDPLSDDETSDSAGAEASGYEEEDESATLSPGSSVRSEDEFSSEDEKPKKRGAKPKGSGPRDPVAGKGEGQELWRQGVKAGLGPGNQIFIERPKARLEGSVKYFPDKIHPNTMEFLKDLKENNDREWLKGE